jgi:hypothetical protein
MQPGNYASDFRGASLIKAQISNEQFGAAILVDRFGL